MSKRLLASLLLVFSFSFFVASSVGAQGASGTNGPIGGRSMEEFQREVKIHQIQELVEDQIKGSEGEINQGTYYTSALEKTAGIFFEGMVVGLPNENGTQLSGGLIGTTSQLMASMYANPAASGQTYLADIFNSAGMLGAQPAYAQGLGFSSLSPILEVWKVFRNIAYFFFVAIFIVIGFMIMFRQKISGQAVVTAQQAIPSVIVALLLVTFSYAIAGFLIDLMYLVMFLLVGLFGKNTTTFIDGNILQLGVKIVASNLTSVGEEVSSFVNDSLGGNFIGGLVGIGAGLFVAVIFAVAIMIGMFRLFFNLLKRYVGIILSIALAPIILMAGAIPGQNTFGPWIKSLIGNLAAFPILLLALIVSDTVTGNFSGTTPLAAQYGGFIPPYLGGSNQSGSGNTMIFLLGLGILLVLSELVDKGAQALGAGKGPFDDIVAAAGKNLAAGEIALPLIGGVAGGAVGGAQSYREARRQGARGRDFLRIMRSGYEATDSAGNTRTYGGVFRQAGAGATTGQSVRRVIDDAQDGRLFDPNNLYKQLAELNKNQRANEKKPKENTPPAST